MNDVKLWIDKVGCTVTITGANFSCTMPLWVFEDICEIVVAEAEKKVEVTHRDFDIQQELLDRYRVENDKLRGLVRDIHALATDHDVYVRYSYCHSWDEKLDVVEEQMRELGIEVDK